MIRVKLGNLLKSASLINTYKLVANTVCHLFQKSRFLRNCLNVTYTL